eukprot:9384185-Ditylum_brightwellii.AAC.1
MERIKQNKHLICNKNGESVDDGVDNGDDDGIDDDFCNCDDGDDSANKHLAHLTEAADCCLAERSKQNKHVVCNKDDDVDNGDNDSVEDDVDN